MNLCVLIQALPVYDTRLSDDRSMIHDSKSDQSPEAPEPQTIANTSDWAQTTITPVAQHFSCAEAKNKATGQEHATRLYAWSVATALGSVRKSFHPPLIDVK